MTRCLAVVHWFATRWQPSCVWGSDWTLATRYILAALHLQSSWFFNVSSTSSCFLEYLGNKLNVAMFEITKTVSNFLFLRSAHHACMHACMYVTARPLNYVGYHVIISAPAHSWHLPFWHHPSYTPPTPDIIIPDVTTSSSAPLSTPQLRTSWHNCSWSQPPGGAVWPGGLDLGRTPWSPDTPS